MDKRSVGTVNFRNVVRFGYFMSSEAGRVGETSNALTTLFERAKPMLLRSPASCSPMTS